MPKVSAPARKVWCWQVSRPRRQRGAGPWALVIAGGRGFAGHFVRAIGVIAQVDRVGMAPAFSGRISLSKGWELSKGFPSASISNSAAPAAPGASAPLVGNGSSMFVEMLQRLETDPLWAREYEDFVRAVSFAGPRI